MSDTFASTNNKLDRLWQRARAARAARVDHDGPGAVDQEVQHDTHQIIG